MLAYTVGSIQKYLIEIYENALKKPVGAEELNK